MLMVRSVKLELSVMLLLTNLDLKSLGMTMANWWDLKIPAPMAVIP